VKQETLVKPVKPEQQAQPEIREQPAKPVKQVILAQPVQPAQRVQLE
jgi:hypothetical protein